jgi:hypothetical protein
MDRATLFSLVLAETTRPDKASELPDILLLVEAKIARELRCIEMETSTALDFTTPLTQACAFPADFLGIRSLYNAAGDPLQQVGLMEYYSNTQLEKVYAVAPGKFLARITTATLLYFARPAPMAGSSDTTAVLDAHPDLYVNLMSFYVYRRTQDLELAQAALSSSGDARDTLNELADRQRGAARVGKGYTFGNGVGAF